MFDVYKKWLSEVLSEGKGTETKGNVIYKGFVFREVDGELDLYHFKKDGEGYIEIDKKSLDVLLKLGFVKGVDTIVYRKNLKRIHYHKKAIEQLTKIKEEFSVEKHIQGIFANDNKKNLQHVLKNHVDAYYELKIRITNYKKKWK